MRCCLASIGLAVALLGCGEDKPSEPADPGPVELPAAAAELIQGRAAIHDGCSFPEGPAVFVVELYNGSEWTVEKVRLSITAADSAQTERWTREYDIEIYRLHPSYRSPLEPRSSKTVDLEVGAADCGLRLAAWHIVAAWGRR